MKPSIANSLNFGLSHVFPQNEDNRTVHPIAGDALEAGQLTPRHHLTRVILTPVARSLHGASDAENGESRILPVLVAIVSLTGMAVGGGRGSGVHSSGSVESTTTGVRLPLQPARCSQTQRRDPKISAPIPFFATCGNQSSSMKFSNGGTSGYSLTTSCSGISRLA